MERHSSNNFSTRSHGPLNDLRDSSALGRMQERYWATKQAVFKKIGKKNDDCIVASDSELDAKLELFQNIEDSFLSLLRVLENFQDRLCVFAQEENAVGRFLKENGKYDKTRAGRIMINTGKALSYTAQQMLSMRLPLIRLYQEVETFQYRAIVDTFQTVEKMELARTNYRGALMWMKDASQQLDPDTGKQLERFRKVQSHVRKSKTRFDKLKLDTMQKVDLLSFSRCNLFSQALAAYQNTFLTMCKKVAQTLDSVAETTKGYQHYEFTSLKELTEPSKKLSEKTFINHNVLPTDDADAILFFESEYHDEVEKTKAKNETDETANGTPSLKRKMRIKKEKDVIEKDIDGCNSPLLNFEDNDENFEGLLNEIPFPPKNSELLNITQFKSSTNKKDLLTDNSMSDDSSKSDLELLNEILGTNQDYFSPTEFHPQWQASCSYDIPSSFEAFQIDNSEAMQSKFSNSACFLPSQLLDMSSGQKFKTKETSDVESNQFVQSPQNNNTENSKGKQDMTGWFNLFADLDPLANPDLIGRKLELDDRNC